MNALLGFSALVTALMASPSALPQKAQIAKTEETYSVDLAIPSFYDYILVRTEGGEPVVVTEEDMIRDLAQYDVIFMGEAHGHVASHLVQSKVLSGLYAYKQDLSLSMEQFERSQQRIVDAYLNDEIGEEKLIHDGKAWDHYRSSYRSLVEFAKAKDLPVLAAEVPAGMVSCVGEEGPDFLNRIDGEARGWIARKLHLEDGAYKTKYMSFLDKAPGHSVGNDLSDEEKERQRFYRYAAQVARDDTMAESIADHLKSNPGRTVVHTNGAFHSAGFLGTPERVLIHLPNVELANVHTLSVEDPEAPSFTEADLKEGQYLLLVQAAPKRFRGMAEIDAFVKRTQDAIAEKRCTY